MMFSRLYYLFPRFKISNKSKFWIWKLFQGSLALIILLFSVTNAIAQAPEKTPAFVYAITAFDGQIYQSSFAPPSVDSIYLIADESNILASRNTNIYFWPLSNKFEADWLAKNEFVDGNLEILQNNKMIQNLKSVDYIVQYNANDPVATRNLATGDDATNAYQNFKTAQKSYRDDLSKYYKEQQDYRKIVDKLISDATNEGKIIPESDFPQQPKPVAPFELFSTEISRGFVVNLPAGTYTVQLRLPNGKVQPNSIKKLTSFSMLRPGISFNVVPQERWTRPDVSRSNGGVIYAPIGNVVYLQPFYQGQYNDYAYGHMINPQDNTGRVDRSRWVSFGQISDAKLEVTRIGQKPIMESAAGYKVVQMNQSGLGYEVKRLVPGSAEIPSFFGYEVMIANKVDSYSVRLINAEGVEELGSFRIVRQLNTSNASWMYVFSVFPILYGGISWFVRRRSIKKIRVEG